jgi:hypothetical protein
VAWLFYAWFMRVELFAPLNWMLPGCRRHHKSGEAIHISAAKNDELLEGAAMLVVLRRAMTQV